MINHNKYYYKGYDISNENNLEKLEMEYYNKYRYKINSNKRRMIDNELMCTRTNQDCVKNKKFDMKKD